MTWILIFTNHRKWYKKISHAFLFDAPTQNILDHCQDVKADTNSIISLILAYDIFGLLLVFLHKTFLLEYSMDRNILSGSNKFHKIEGFDPYNEILIFGQIARKQDDIYKP